MNLVHIKLFDFVLHILCVVQLVRLYKMASAITTGIEHDSNLRRQQRFLTGYALNYAIIAKVIFALQSVKTERPHVIFAEKLLFLRVSVQFWHGFCR